MERLKSRLLVFALIVAGMAALYCAIVRPPVSTLPKHLRDPMADLKPIAAVALEPPPLVVPDIPAITLPPLRPPARIVPNLTPPELPIQDRATIDFSTGAPVVRRGGTEEETLDRTIQEMADAAKKTSFEANKAPDAAAAPKTP